jgi:hypothetical protein
MDLILSRGEMTHGDPMSPEEAKLIELAGNFVEVHLSPLVRVVAIGQQVEADGVRVELIALEVREAGAVLYWRAFATKDRILGLAVIEVSDDLGGEYRVFLGGGGGGERAWSGETNVVPAPTAGASILRVKVTGFEGFPPGFPGTAQVVTNEGPWVFEIPLGG